MCFLSFQDKGLSILRSLCSVRYLVQLLGLSDRREISSGSFVILALPGDSQGISHSSLNSHSVDVLPALGISVMRFCSAF